MAADRERSTMPPIEKLLPLLGFVKKTGDRKWLARCPAHDDKRPSLSIREVDDGTVLIKCWSGCGGVEVVEAVGLSARDLFPQAPNNRPALRPGQRWVPREALEALSHELLIAAMSAEMLALGDVLDQAARDRLALAAARISAASREVGNGC